jgi:hypothetical protein
MATKKRISGRRVTRTPRDPRAAANTGSRTLRAHHNVDRLAGVAQQLRFEDMRLPDRLRMPELLPLGSRVRRRLMLDYAGRDELLTSLDHLLRATRRS